MCKYILSFKPIGSNECMQLFTDKQEVFNIALGLSKSKLIEKVFIIKCLESVNGRIKAAGYLYHS